MSFGAVNVHHRLMDESVSFSCSTFKYNIDLIRQFAACYWHVLFLFGGLQFFICNMLPNFNCSNSSNNKPYLSLQSRQCSNNFSSLFHCFVIYIYFVAWWKHIASMNLVFSAEYWISWGHKCTPCSCCDSGNYWLQSDFIFCTQWWNYSE